VSELIVGCGFGLTHRCSDEIIETVDQDTPRKRRKMDPSRLKLSLSAWTEFERDVDEFDVQHVQGRGKFAFGFVEGPIVKALRSGDWYAGVGHL
jgi:midasin